MKITVKRSTPNKNVLKQVYDIMNKNIKNQNCFYSKDQVRALKKDKTTIWL